MIVKLPINKIIIPQGLLPRIFGVNEEKVEEYAEAMENGAEFPPIKVWEKLDGTYQVIDGVHRISAYRKLGKEYIEAEIIQGIEDEVAFMEWAIRENLKHGLPLSREDKREDARRLYIKGRKPESIARLFKVSLRTVYNWIGDLKEEEKLEKEKLKQKALELYREGYTQGEIAKELGVEQGTISKWLRNYSTLKDFKTEYQPTQEEPSYEEEVEEYDGSWDDWNEEEETEEEQVAEEPKAKPKKESSKEEKKLLHPNHILERDKNAIWDAVIEIEFHFGEEKALEVLEEIYFAYKERKHKGLTIYKDRRALFIYNQKRGN
ncbi:helix-turn-helix domain-containing protein [Persephonella sp.]|uniref:helix-turn-helix domain-containing protein n=1 Tax=Persephonella sp. TaxID=2060922 RepID=UPI00261C2B3D|nr:helix-turn-helix domain-containing protein [Persephonella sp.]